MNASKLGKPSLGDAPEVLDAVDVVRSGRTDFRVHGIPRSAYESLSKRG